MSSASIELSEADVTNLLERLGWVSGPVEDVSVLRKEQRWTKKREHRTTTLVRVWSRSRFDPRDEEHAAFVATSDARIMCDIAEADGLTLREAALIALAR